MSDEQFVTQTMLTCLGNKRKLVGEIKQIAQEIATTLGKEKMRIVEILENFADGKKKGKSRPGRVKRSGASCKGSVTSLRAKAKKYGGEKGKMYHWCANMKGGKKK